MISTIPGFDTVIGFETSTVYDPQIIPNVIIIHQELNVCEGNFDCDDDVDGSDAALFKIDFGRGLNNNQCTNDNPCNGDFDCDQDVEGSDAALFKSDSGRSSFNNPCPACVVGEWCGY